MDEKTNDRTIIPQQDLERFVKGLTNMIVNNDTTPATRAMLPSAHETLRCLLELAAVRSALHKQIQEVIQQ